MSKSKCIIDPAVKVKNATPPIFTLEMRKINKRGVLIGFVIFNHKIFVLTPSRMLYKFPSKFKCNTADTMKDYDSEYIDIIPKTQNALVEHFSSNTNLFSQISILPRNAAKTKISNNKSHSMFFVKVHDSTNRIAMVLKTFGSLI